MNPPTTTDGKAETAADLYLDLMKKALSNTIFEEEPDDAGDGADSQALFCAHFLSHYMESNAVSMLPKARLNNIQKCIVDVVEQGVPGDLIETGVWRGGAVIFMRAVLKAYGITDRTVWVADSFEGLPAPDATRFPIEFASYNAPVLQKAYGRFAVGIEEVQRNFAAFGLLDGKVKFLKGWFRDTLPVAPIERLAVMRLDGDYYESTMDGLVNLYQKLSPGGYAIIDDYGEDQWTYCRKAVDEFRTSNGIVEPLVPVDSKCVFWRRER